MARKSGARWMVAMLAALPLAACSGQGGGVNSAGTSATGSGGSSGGLSVPSLVNVDLSNVLNDLAVRLNLDKANVPINAQIPITLAVNICGVSINVLSVSTGGQANCTAKTSSPELAQVVQQQIAAGGSVGGGAQGDSSAGTSGTTASGTGTGTAAGATTGTTTGTGSGATGSATGTTTGTTAPSASTGTGAAATGSTGTNTGTAASTTPQ